MLWHDFCYNHFEMYRKIMQIYAYLCKSDLKNSMQIII